MMGDAAPQDDFLHAVTLEQLVPPHHPLRKIRPLIDTKRIRELCKDYYCENNGRPSIPPEQLFLAWLGGYLLGCRSDRVIVRQLQCDMAFRWFVGLDISSKVWDDSTFAKNRTQRFEGTEIFEKLFDDAVKRAMREGWVSDHWSIDGTLVRANASQKSLAQLDPAQSPEDYREKISGKKKTERTKKRDDDKHDPGNPDVRWDGQKRSNATHRSTTDPDARLASKGKEGAQLNYQVNGVMENRNRFLVGVGVEIFTGSTGEREGGLKLLTRARKKLRLKPKSLGADKGYFESKFLGALVKKKIKPHVAALERAGQDIHRYVKSLATTKGYQASNRARKRIEELWGEAKECHGFRRFARRGLERVRQEALMIGWLLNLKRIATLTAAT
jgi:transposase